MADFWTNGEISQLLNLFDSRHKTVDEIGQLLNRSSSSVRNKLHSLGKTMTVIPRDMEGKRSSSGGKIVIPSAGVLVHMKVYAKSKIGGRG